MDDMIIDEKIAYLTKEANAAQNNGNYRLVEQLEEMIKKLQQEKFEMQMQAVGEELEQPKTK